MNYLEKLRTFLTSRRAGIFLAAVAFVIFAPHLGYDASTTNKIAGLAAAWIFGDTFRKTQ